jgi:hypothetical protein
VNYIRVLNVMRKFKDIITVDPYKALLYKVMDILIIYTDGSDFGIGGIL